MHKVLVGMSGGVDSSVAAYLALQSGYDVLGTTLALCDGLPNVTPANTRDAQLVAQKLNIPFSCVDMSSDFRNKVVDPFIAQYESGLTPNPCFFCNCSIKFDKMLEYAQSQGCNYVVTGHYAKIEKDPETGRFLLRKARDTQKDQSYFLAGLTQYQLSHILLPLGNLSKNQVREIAESQEFINANRKDSQDICFIPDGDYVQFIKEYTQKEYPCGTFQDRNGNILGKHNGAIQYTIGQRKGLHLSMGTPVYVCAKNMEENTVTVGPNSALFHKKLNADCWNWISFDSLTGATRVEAKIRYRHTAQPATVYPGSSNSATVIFDEPQRAITPGQAVVLYKEDIVIGSGIIRSAMD